MARLHKYPIGSKALNWVVINITKNKHSQSVYQLTCSTCGMEKSHESRLLKTLEPCSHKVTPTIRKRKFPVITLDGITLNTKDWARKINPLNAEREYKNISRRLRNQRRDTTITDFWVVYGEDRVKPVIDKDRVVYTLVNSIFESLLPDIVKEVTSAVSVMMNAAVEKRVAETLKQGKLTPASSYSSQEYEDEDEKIIQQDAALALQWLEVNHLPNILVSGVYMNMCMATGHAEPCLTWEMCPRLYQIQLEHYNSLEGRIRPPINQTKPEIKNEN